MNLVERESHAKLLVGMLADGLAGRGRVALVSGGIATGKTELIYGFTESVRDALVLTATGARGEQQFELGVVEQLFYSAAMPADVATHARALLVSAMAEDSTGGEDARSIHDICALLLDLSREQPLVIAVDDVQFADRTSLRVLLHLQRKIRSAAVLLVLGEAAGTSTRPAHTALRDEIVRQPQARHLRLRPLSPEGVRDLLAHHLGPQAAADLEEPCHVLSGGNPLLVHALIEDFVAADRPATELGVSEPVTGDAFAQAVYTCLRRGEELLLRVAQGVAVLGELAKTELLARLLELDSRTVRDLFKTMNEAGLMDADRFRHPVARTAVLRELDPDELSALRLRAARLLHDDGVPAVTVAEYITAAECEPGAWAVPVLRDAAAEALARNDVHRAVDCLDLARTACGDERETIAVTATLAEAQWLVDPAAAAQHLTRLGAAFHRGLLPEREAWGLVRALVWFGRSAEAAAVLAELDGTAPDSAGPDSASPVEGEPNDCGTGRHVTRHWLATVQPQLLGDLAADLDGRQLDTPAAVESAERVLRSARIGETPLEELICALQALNHGDRGDRAGYWCDEFLEEARAHRAVTWRAALSDVAAAVALRRGDLVSAERLARAALGALPAPSWGVGIGSPLATLVQATTRLGKFQEADAQLRQGVPQAVQQTRHWAQYLLARGQHHLATDRLRAALADFLAVGELAAEWRLDLPVLLPWRQEAAQVHVRMGEPERARELVDQQLTLPGADGARVRGVSLRILASASAPGRRLPLLRESVDLLGGLGDWYELALAFADLSAAHQASAEFDQARIAARRALRLAKSCKAKPLHEHLQHHRTATGGLDFNDSAEYSASATPLSAAERRVAGLAALGYTNREISRRLYITVSTVEQHLTRTYRKLKINRRTDLPILANPVPGGSPVEAGPRAALPGNRQA
ncbi:helix-turn-helix transcriptional regulator [Saccharothrix sp. NRRL B-16314]|uniref:helix-turn-helix transcriptional regulator n=1 Tax=Saccharothrix sp. NRRL B-16314 TaxID=1463825 RepID=UPI0007C4F584|nr:LuxR family transcriptional regulator [Saccharothrix sp. NRRL B-16314]